MNENLISSNSTNEDISSEEITHSNFIPTNPELIKNKTIINQITEILNNCKKNKQKEELTCEEILNFIKNNNINITEIKNVENSTLIQIYCCKSEDYNLKCMLLCMDKLLNEKEIESYMLNEDSSKMNIFEMSSEIGDLKIFRLLKKYLKDNKNILNHLINIRSEGKINLFHIAADNNKIISLLFFYSFYYNNTSYLNLKNKSSLTPLHIACYRGNYEFVQYLVNLGADIDCIDSDGKTPLFYAVQSSNVKITKFLILSGANKKIKDNKNKTVIELTSDKDIYNILENKNIFRIAFKCETNFQSLKNHHRNIFMLILLIFLIIFHLYIIIKYKASNFTKKCCENKNFSFEISLLIMNIIFEIFCILIYIFFQLLKKKKLDNNNKNINYNKFCIRENGIEYYEMFKYNENICVKCQRVKELNTQHCIACDMCIDNFDHHCFFLNICIDNSNKKYFYLFLAESLFTIIVNLLTSFVFFIDFVKFSKIYYGLIYNDITFERTIIFDFIIYILDILYFLLSLFLILSSIIPFIFYVESKKKLKSEEKKNNSNKSDAPLLPINTNSQI